MPPFACRAILPAFIAISIIAGQAMAGDGNPWRIDESGDGDERPEKPYRGRDEARRPPAARDGNWRRQAGESRNGARWRNEGGGGAGGSGSEFANVPPPPVPAPQESWSSYWARRGTSPGVSPYGQGGQGGAAPGLQPYAPGYGYGYGTSPYGTIPGYGPYGWPGYGSWGYGYAPGGANYGLFAPGAPGLAFPGLLW
jgi:hypothetical protein